MRDMRLLKPWHACKLASFYNTAQRTDPKPCLSLPLKLRDTALRSIFTFSKKLEDHHGAQSAGARMERHDFLGHIYIHICIKFLCRVGCFVEIHDRSAGRAALRMVALALDPSARTLSHRHLHIGLYKGVLFGRQSCPSITVSTYDFYCFLHASSFRYQYPGPLDNPVQMNRAFRLSGKLPKQ